MIIREGLQETVAYFLPRNFTGGNVRIYEKYISELTVSMSGIELEVFRKQSANHNTAVTQQIPLVLYRRTEWRKSYLLPTLPLNAFTATGFTFTHLCHVHIFT